MEGFHCWPEADGELAYLKNSHRHIFFITAEFPVRNANREIEIISQQNAIKRYLLSKYGDEDGACHFGRRSCEDIAAEILNQFENSTSCTVLEDGFGGARVVRYNENANESGTITITLMGTSSSLPYVRSLALKRKEVSVMIVDANDSASVNVAEERCRVIKPPDITRAKEIGSESVSIFVPSLNYR